MNARPSRSDGGWHDRAWRVGLRAAYQVQLVWWRLRRPSIHGAYVAVWWDDRVLVIKNSYRRRVSFPAGGLNRRETAREAAVRELREEVGSSVSPDALHYFGEIVGDEGPAEDHAHVFELRCEARPTFVVDGREVVWAEFLSPAEALDRGAVEVVRRYLATEG